MERTISITLATLLSLFISSRSLGRTWVVRKDGPLASIQQAERMASPHDTLLVQPGVYLEKSLIIDKPLFLRGIRGAILDGESRYEVIVVKADDVVIEGFTIRHSGYSGWNDIAGIRILAVRRVIVRNNILDDTFFGIYSQNADSCLIEGNSLKSRAAIQSGNGIHCWKCNRMQILNNSITRHRDGIYFEFVTNSLIRGNQSLFNLRYGLHFMFSHNDRYENNIFEHNEAGVSVMFSHGVEMKANTFTQNLGGGAYGILMKEISDSRVEGNHFTHNTIGIYMEGTTRVHIHKNTFSGNGWAMKIQASCSDDTIARNNFAGNTFDVATNGALVLNTFDGNYWDKYEGYDLNRDGIGDIPFRPVSLYTMIAEKNPVVMMLYHSFMVTMLDKTEKVIPSITPVNLLDNRPFMKPLTL